jgi:serine/threonine protein phosphatase PrpC
VTRTAAGLTEGLGDVEVPVAGVANALVGWAVEQGGADNISVALARVEK